MKILKFLIRRIALNFPARFLLCATFFSILALEWFSQIQMLENQSLAYAFHFLRIPAYLTTSGLYLGNFYSPIVVSAPLHVQLLFGVFFLSLATSTSSSLSMRLRILSYAALCAIFFPTSEVFLDSALYCIHIPFSVDYLYGSYIVASLVGAFLIEACLFKNITWPRGTPVRPFVSRTYIDEYLFFLAMLASSVIMMYALASVLQISSDSITFSYLVLNITVIFSFNNFLAYFLMEARLPAWIKRRPIGRQKPKVISFLLPAYNEEGTIQRCIESIDRAAANYRGGTEIIVVNDGSTDRTRELASSAIMDLKNCDGVVFNIPNSGKGSALRYGLKRTSGQIIFRIDTDSVIEAGAISPIVSHFSDPSVGSVSGVIVPMEEKSIWQKIISLDFIFLYLFYKREEELVDSIMVQSGAFSVFSKDALMRVGGWAEDRYGEDGEITIRLGRYGYKNELEPRAVLRTDQPSDWKKLREQRIRWNIGYYYSRSANFSLIREFRGPRTMMYLFGMYAHGVDFAYAVSLPFFILGLAFEYYSSAVPAAEIFDDISKIIIVDLLLFGLQHLFHPYCAYKFRRPDLIAYIPLLRIYNIINQVVFRTEAVEILLAWSSRWKKYDKRSFHALRRAMRSTLST